MDFIRWFKGSLEDEKGVASFRRIYNWILICLVVWIVVYYSIKDKFNMFHIYVLIILLVAGFLNTSVITADNILRFFNRDRDYPEPQQTVPPVQHVEGTLNVQAVPDTQFTPPPRTPPPTSA